MHSVPIFNVGTMTLRISNRPYINFSRKVYAETSLSASNTHLEDKDVTEFSPLPAFATRWPFGTSLHAELFSRNIVCYLALSAFPQMLSPIRSLPAPRKGDINIKPQIYANKYGNNSLAPTVTNFCTLPAQGPMAVGRGARSQHQLRDGANVMECSLLFRVSWMQGAHAPGPSWFRVLRVNGQLITFNHCQLQFQRSNLSDVAYDIALRNAVRHHW
jgi:hypothetical protein